MSSTIGCSSPRLRSLFALMTTFPQVLWPIVPDRALFSLRARARRGSALLTILFHLTRRQMPYFIEA
jgi:hypothetical protein